MITVRQHWVKTVWQNLIVVVDGLGCRVFASRERFQSIARCVSEDVDFLSAPYGNRDLNTWCIDADPKVLINGGTEPAAVSRCLRHRRQHLEELPGSHELLVVNGGALGLQEPERESIEVGWRRPGILEPKDSNQRFQGVPGRTPSWTRIRLEHSRTVRTWLRSGNSVWETLTRSGVGPPGSAT